MKRETNIEDYFRSTSCLSCKPPLYSSGVFLNLEVFLLVFRRLFDFFNHNEIS